MDGEEITETFGPLEEALRFNEGKPQLSFLLSAPSAIESCAKVMEFGARKYSRDNWKKGLSRENVADSLLRHLTAYLNGEVLDPESGIEHTGHILCNALFLAEFQSRGDYD